MGKSRRDMEEEIKYLRDKCIELEQELLAERHLRQSEAVRGYNGLVDEVVALEQERAMPCGHAQRLAVHSKDFIGGGPDCIGTSYCGECEKIAALEQELDASNDVGRHWYKCIKRRDAEVERLRAAIAQMALDLDRVHLHMTNASDEARRALADEGE